MRGEFDALGTHRLQDKRVPPEYQAAIRSLELHGSEMKCDALIKESKVILHWEPSREATRRWR